MAWAALIIVASVASGTLLALLPQATGRLLGPVRTFAFSAAVGVIFLHMLPEALLELGLWALVALPLGLLAPEALGRLGAALFRATSPGREAPRHLALEASYFGLLAHRVGDGIGLGVYTGELAHGAGAGGVLAALAAHAVPVVAIVVLTFDSVRGRGSALKRAVGLGFASGVGVLLTHTVLAQSFAHASGFIAAFVSGMLLHVVSHELGLQLPMTSRDKLVDTVGALLGVGASFAGVGLHVVEHETEETHVILSELASSAERSAPPLVAGILLVALICFWLDRRSSRPGSAWVLGRGVALESSLLSVALIGGLWTLARLSLSGLFETRSSAVSPTGTGEAPMGEPAQFESGNAASGDKGQFKGKFELTALWIRRLEGELPWLIIAWLLAANLAAGLPEGTLSKLSAPEQLGCVAVLTLLVRLPCSASLVLGTALLPKGLMPGALFALLVLGPVSPRGTRFWRVAPKEGVAWLALLLVVGLLTLAGESVGAFAQVETAPLLPGRAGLTGVGLILVLWSIGRRGLRASFSELWPHGHGSSH